ncbi:MAG: DUF4377 domain-containing protein [Comamonas sp.]
MIAFAPRLAACAAAALMLAACAGSPSATTPSSTSSTAPSTMPASTATSPLYAYHWDLERAVDAKGAALPQYAGTKAPVRLTFLAAEGSNGAHVSVANLCNVMSAGVEVDGDKMRVGRPMSTMRACADNQLMALENLVGQQISTIQQFKLSDAGSQPRLELRLADGSTWHLAGKPTDETQYGGKPERIFLEVAPQRVACSHPLMPNHQCLQVRTVQYADNGTKKSVGEWSAFYDEIKGYQHEAGVRNVLRVNRYERKNVPADASRYVYVLDMRVESEIAR